MARCNAESFYCDPNMPCQIKACGRKKKTAQSSFCKTHQALKDNGIDFTILPETNTRPILDYRDLHQLNTKFFEDLLVKLQGMLKKLQDIQRKLQKKELELERSLQAQEQTKQLDETRLKRLEDKLAQKRQLQTQNDTIRAKQNKLQEEISKLTAEMRTKQNPIEMLQREVNTIKQKQEEVCQVQKHLALHADYIKQQAIKVQTEFDAQFVTEEPVTIVA